MFARTGSKGLHGGIVLAVLVAMATSGCGNDARKEVESSDHMKDLSYAIIMYQSEKKAWPDKLDQVKPMLAKGKDFATVMTNPLTGDNPGYEYVAPKGEPSAASSTTIVLYQLRGGKRDTSLAVAYADGSVHKADK